MARTIYVVMSHVDRQQKRCPPCMDTLTQLARFRAYLSMISLSQAPR